MKKGSIPVQYFLGANTAEGFISYYHEFLTDPGDRLWYIKGGPGNGKSTLMRSIARAAENQGKTVEYAFCSGDPDSLDGIYIREDHLGYVDATSPHVQEPGEPGASGQYLDLSGCYRTGLKAHQQEIKEFFRRYREQYARSYDLLKAASLTAPGRLPGLVDESDREEVKAQAAALAQEFVAEEPGFHAEHRFLSVHSCKGIISLWDEINAESAYLVDNTRGLADTFLQEVQRKCRKRGCHVILCPDPISPGHLEGLILPEQGLLFRAFHEQDASPSRVAGYIPLNKRENSGLLSERYRRSLSLQQELILEAEACLREAKRLHDQLEALYRPYVDFNAVDEIVRQQLQRI